MATYKILCVLLPCVVTFTSFATVSGDDSLLVYENAESRGFHTSDAEFTPDGAYVLVVGYWNGRHEQQELRVWSLERREFVAEHRFEDEGRIMQIGIAPDGETLLLLTRIFDSDAVGNVWLYSWEHGESRQGRFGSLLTPIRLLASAVESANASLLCGTAVFSPDASQIAIDRHEYSTPNGWESVVGVMRPSGSVVNLLRPEVVISGVEFLNDNSTLATTSHTVFDLNAATHSVEVELTLWNSSSGDEIAREVVTDTIRRPGGGVLHFGASSKLAVSPDGDLLASDGPDYAVQLWTVDPLAPHRQLTGFTEGLSCAEFHPELEILNHRA